MNKLLTYPEITLKAVESDKHYKLTPTEDITPFECSKLLELFVYVVATRKDCDWESFVIDNKLQRHFVETEIEKK
jgi:hypothetical protein